MQPGNTNQPSASAGSSNNTTPSKDAPSQGAIQRGLDAVRDAVGGVSGQGQVAGAAATQVNITVNASTVAEDKLGTVETMMKGAGMGLVICTNGAPVPPTPRTISSSLYPTGVTVADMLRTMYEQAKPPIPRTFLDANGELVSPYVPTGVPMLLTPPPLSTGLLGISWLGIDHECVAGGSGNYQFAVSAVVQEEGPNALPPPPFMSISYNISRGSQDGFNANIMLLMTTQDPMLWKRQTYKTLVESAYYPGPSTETVGPRVTPTLPAGVTSRQYLAHRNFPVVYAGYLVYKAVIEIQSAALTVYKRDALLTFLTSASVQSFIRTLQTGRPAQDAALLVKADASAIGIE